MKLANIASFCVFAAASLSALTHALPGSQRMTLVRYSWGSKCEYFLDNCPEDHATCPAPKAPNGERSAIFLAKDELKPNACKTWADDKVTDFGAGMFHIPQWTNRRDYEKYNHCILTFYDEKKCKGGVLYEYNSDWDNRHCVNMSGARSVRTHCHS